MRTAASDRHGVETNLATWLADRAVAADGTVFSWRNPDHDGFPYPEAAALALHFWSTYGGPHGLRKRVAATLERQVALSGGLGKEGREYAFDASVALAALEAAVRVGVPCDARVRERLLGFLRETLHHRGSALPHDLAKRWSSVFGGHLIKACARLAAADPASHALAQERTSELLGLFDDGRFVIWPGSSLTYLHAHAYALEGLLLLDRARPQLERGVAWLAEVQDAGGGFCAWYGDRGTMGPLRADATAQAVRLWCCVNASTYDAPIRRALAFLRGLMVTDGGLRYEPGSRDINTWATVFALQAFRWARRGGGRVAELI